MANTFVKYFIDIVPYLDIQINEEHLYLIKTLNTFIILMRLIISVSMQKYPSRGVLRKSSSKNMY